MRAVAVAAGLDARLGTRLLDRMFGTEWPDYEQAYERVSIDERPLIRLAERMSPRSS